MLASAGAGRYLAALGAEVIKVEHESRADGMRFGPAACPVGGRAERQAATDTMPTPPRDGLNRSGSFMEINAGKLALSLDLKKPEGKRILEDLIRTADVVLEGYSPGTMDRMGLGYDRLRALNPGIIYLQQSGFGQHGVYGRARAFGPTAQAFSGISDMSGLPEPRPPAGIGYSYLDWFGAYNMATAALAALYRRATTGRGCHVDASQAEVGIFLTGTAVLDHSVNGRRWSRYGNRSPWRLAAPHGAYRTRGEDRWIAIAAFTDAEWRAVASALGHPEWLDDPRFDGLSNRRANEDALDDLMSRATGAFDGADLMGRLQAAGVPAGTLPDGRGPLRKGSPASPSGVAGRVAANRARHVAGEGLPCAPRAQPGLRRRDARPLRSQLRRGYRARSVVGSRHDSRAGGRAARGPRRVTASCDGCVEIAWVGRRARRSPGATAAAPILVLEGGTEAEARAGLPIETRSPVI